MPDISELGYGIVRGRFVAGILDSADPGAAPDFLPLMGRVDFTATAAAVRVVSANPAPVTVFPSTISVTLDAEGYLSWNGSRDVALLATDDTDGNPVNWQWKASFFLTTVDNDPIPYPGFNFNLPAGTVADLTSVAPLVESSPGVFIIKGPAGDAGGAVQLRKNDDNTYIQWKRSTDAAWTNLVALADLKGPAGTGSTGGSGVPAGGTAGQVLKKNSATAGDAAWDTLDSSDVGLGAVDNTADTAKPVSAAQKTELDKKAALASPNLTGIPKAPTAADGDNTTQIATTAFVLRELAKLLNAAPAALDTITELAKAIDNDPAYADTVARALSTKAPLASPALTGEPTTTTPAAAANNTQIANTAWVRTAIAGVSTPVYVIYYDTATSSWKGQGGVAVPASAPSGVLVRFVDRRDAASTVPAYAGAKWPNVTDIYLDAEE